MCAVAGCLQRSLARGLCTKHYQRVRNRGTTEPHPDRRNWYGPPEGRFWPHVNKTGSCWLWEGRRTPNGYGRFNATHSKAVMAHRFAYELLRGPIPDGTQLDHLCLVILCVNPGHLEIVTPLENVTRSSAPSAVVRRSGYCTRHHKYTPENTYTNPTTGKKVCRICRQEYEKRHRPYRDRPKKALGVEAKS